jgi:hypothetical protein
MRTTVGLANGRKGACRRHDGEANDDCHLLDDNDSVAPATICGMENWPVLKTFVIY